MKRIFLLMACAAICGTAPAHDQQPGDTSLHEMFSPREHAELYINLVFHLYYALIPRMDSVTDEASAAKVQREIIALHRRLNMAIDHMEHNPDMRREVVAILKNDPARCRHLKEHQARYNASAQRCRDTGLIPDMPTIRRVTIPVGE